MSEASAGDSLVNLDDRTAKALKYTEDASKAAGRLRKHLAIVILVKLIALMAIWWCFFRAELRPPADDAAVAKQIFSSERNR